ncbi:hypothetical protein Tco_0909912 [Tanacetum coccineum]|uniref:Uncharacterized protein n=1 Tax=Tanacetum coccineum TaxID=301880 RepID=A0ABQ5CT35_9ASTR
MYRTSILADQISQFAAIANVFHRSTLIVVALISGCAKFEARMAIMGDDDIPIVVSFLLMGTCQFSIHLGKATPRHRFLQPRENKNREQRNFSSNAQHATYLEKLIPYYMWKAFITQDSAKRDYLVKNLKSFDVADINHLADAHRTYSCLKATFINYFNPFVCSGLCNNGPS